MQVFKMDYLTLRILVHKRRSHAHVKTKTYGPSLGLTNTNYVRLSNTKRTESGSVVVRSVRNYADYRVNCWRVCCYYLEMLTLEKLRGIAFTYYHWNRKLQLEGACLKAAHSQHCVVFCVCLFFSG